MRSMTKEEWLRNKVRESQQDAATKNPGNADDWLKENNDEDDDVEVLVLRWGSPNTDIMLKQKEIDKWVQRRTESGNPPSPSLVARLKKEAERDE